MEVEYDWQNDQSGMHQSKVFFYPIHYGLEKSLGSTGSQNIAIVNRKQFRNIKYCVYYD
jgi:hypothetical protein